MRVLRDAALTMWFLKSVSTLMIFQRGSPASAFHGEHLALLIARTCCSCMYYEWPITGFDARLELLWVKFCNSKAWPNYGMSENAFQQ